MVFAPPLSRMHSLCLCIHPHAYPFLRNRYLVLFVVSETDSTLDTYCRLDSMQRMPLHYEMYKSPSEATYGDALFRLTRYLGSEMLRKRADRGQLAAPVLELYRA